MKQADPAAALAKMFEGWRLKMSSSLHVSFPCKVIAFNAATSKASIQPLIRTTEAEPAVIQNVPALGQRLVIDDVETICLPALKAGDVVMVVCADREMKNALTGDVARVDSNRTHSLNDAVIVGVFPWSL